MVFLFIFYSQDNALSRTNFDTIEFSVQGSDTVIARATRARAIAEVGQSLGSILFFFASFSRSPNGEQKGTSRNDVIVPDYRLSKDRP